MMLISETYKIRLKELAGIISEVSNQERLDAFAKSDERVPYNKELMIKAIQEGREVGVLFQSNNEKYKMPLAKYRIIYPVAIEEGMRFAIREGGRTIGAGVVSKIVK